MHQIFAKLPHITRLVVTLLLVVKVSLAGSTVRFWILPSQKMESGAHELSYGIIKIQVMILLLYSAILEALREVHSSDRCRLLRVLQYQLY
jgi:high-affinity K+ transport system ATPase subunit B